MNIGIENGIPFSVHSPVFKLHLMLTIFTLWGIAGGSSRTLSQLHPRGVLAAISERMHLYARRGNCRFRDSIFRGST